MKTLLKLSSMGDIIHSLVVIPRLKENVNFIIDSSFKDILEHNPYIDNIIPISLRAAKKDKKLFFSEYKRVKELNFDEIYDLQGLFKSAVVAKLASNKRVGYANPREKIATLFYNKKIKSNSNIAIERYLDLFEIKDRDYLENHPKLLFYKDREFDILSKNRKNIVFIIGSTWECRKVLTKTWIELANSLKEENIIVPYVGEDEKKVAFEIAEAASNVTPVTLNLNDLKALIDKIDLLIGNDTGPTFMAWANNINNIILYGCTYSNKIIENRYSKSIEIQRGAIDKTIFNIDKIRVKDILNKIDEFK